MHRTTTITVEASTTKDTVRTNMIKGTIRTNMIDRTVRTNRRNCQTGEITARNCGGETIRRGTMLIMLSSATTGSARKIVSEHSTISCGGIAANRSRTIGEPRFGGAFFLPGTAKCLRVYLRTKGLSGRGKNAQHKRCQAPRGHRKGSNAVRKSR